MLSQQAIAELDKKLARARERMLEIMEAGDSGTVTIGYGVHGLRLVYSGHEKSTPVELTPVTSRKREKLFR